MATTEIYTLSLHDALPIYKKDYKSGEEAKLLVNTNKEGSTVLLFLRSNGRSAEELRTITIEGKSKEVVIKLRKGDMPNIFVQAVTLSDGEVVTQTMQIVLPPEKRRSEEHTSELQSRRNLVCRLLLEKKKNQKNPKKIQKAISTHTVSSSQ